jgi:inorganic triphosphatase YgiF
MASVPKEVELKLAIAPERLEALKVHPDFQDLLREPENRQIDSVYFDTGDFTLRDKGVSWRIRQMGDQTRQTIKVSGYPGGAALLTRSEWEEPVEGHVPSFGQTAQTAIPPDLFERIQGQLAPVFETKINRSEYRLKIGTDSVTMVADRGDIVAGDKTCPVSEIELELTDGDPAVLFRLARSINGVIPATVALKSKSERGYDFLSDKAGEAVFAEKVALQRGMTLAQAFSVIAASCLRQLANNEHALKQRNAEAVHQARIAIRRLRTAISIFADVVTDERATHIKSELRWLAQELAPARDIDAFLREALAPLRKAHPGEAGLATLYRSFSRKRARAFQQAITAVESSRYRNLLIDAIEWIEVGAWRRPTQQIAQARLQQPVEILASAVLARWRKKIRKRAALIDKLNIVQLHRLRLQAKKIRYAAEFFADLFSGRKADKRQKKFKSTLRALQNSLGNLNDIETRKSFCDEMVSRPARALPMEKMRRRAFATGIVVGDQQAQTRHHLERAKRARDNFNEIKAYWKKHSKIAFHLPQQG